MFAALLSSIGSYFNPFSMKKVLISIIIIFAIILLLWIGAPRPSSPHKSTESIEQSTPLPIDPSTSSAPSTDYLEKELCRTVNVYDSTGNVLCIGTINPRETILDLETDGQFELTNSNNQQYKYMTTEHLQGRGKLYVIKLK